MARITLRERFFPLHEPADVDRFLAGFSWCAIFKAGTSEKTFEAWHVVERELEPRVDLPVGFIRLPEDRPASDRVTAVSGVAHRSPQFLLFCAGTSRFHLDEFEITHDRLAPLLGDALPARGGAPVRNEAVVSVEPYRELLRNYLGGTLPDERFQWAYLERLEREAAWRDDEAFEVLNQLFENPDGRALHAARAVSTEFQGQLTGRLEPLKVRAARVLDRLEER